jgi:hypothetical protein
MADGHALPFDPKLPEFFSFNKVTYKSDPLVRMFCSSQLHEIFMRRSHRPA